MRGAKPRHRHGRGNLCAGAAGPAARRADAGAEGRGMIALDRRSAATIAEAVRAGRTSAVAVMEETVARLAAYDAVQPPIWIGRATPDRSEEHTSDLQSLMRNS